MADSLLTNVSVAGIFDKPTFKSEMVTQSLLWEELMIEESSASWFMIKTSDGYKGWINKFYTVFGSRDEIHNATFLHTQILGVLRSEPSITAPQLMQVVFGNELPAKHTCEINRQIWHTILLPDGREGWILDTGYKPLESVRNTINWASKLLIGTPYVWGGRSSLGFDCSGFVQTVFKFAGISLPRNSSQQKDFNGLISIDKTDATLGDLIFFSDEKVITHVGIMYENGEFYHCSGDVKKNSLNPKTPNYNQELQQKFDCVQSIGTFN